MPVDLMHLYFTGAAAGLWHGGDDSLEWILTAAVNGDVFAAGHAKGGNDVPLMYSTTRAERVDGGYRFTGHKSFGSLTPVWTYLGLQGMTESVNGEGPQIVHAFLPRSTEGNTIKETWDVLGMRATRSDDTILDGAFVPDEYIGRVLPIGFAGADHFVLSLFGWFLPLISNVYYGLARRTLDLTLQNVTGKRSLAMTRPMENHQSVQFGIFKKNELERLFCDARLGRIHPANSSFSREVIAKAMLGIDLDTSPRWG